MKLLLSIFNERPNLITNFWPFFKFFSDFWVYSILEKLAPPTKRLKIVPIPKEKNALLCSNSP